MDSCPCPSVCAEIDQLVDFQIRDLEDGDIGDVTGALTTAFGRRFDDDWFNWKHVDNPSGRSFGIVAHDDEGFLGVRLLLRWRFLWDGELVIGMRPCDTVTIPRARRRGVFTAMTQESMERVQDEAAFLFNTPNENSLPGYLKMGFERWTEIHQRPAVEFARIRPVEYGRWMAPSIPETGLHTLRDEAFLRWRYSEKSGFDYRSASLVDDPQVGVIFRRRQVRGLPVVVISEEWGPSRQRSQLRSSVARAEGTRLSWVRAGMKLPFIGQSTTVTIKPLRPGARPPAPELSVGDIEDVL